MLKLLASSILVLALSQLSGCMVFPLQQQDTNRSLNWCPPLPNCVSTDAISFIHSIDKFELIKPIDAAWPEIRKAFSELPRTKIQHEYPGYLYAKSYSRIFHFVDYIELLHQAESNTLSVRSSSLLGISDLLVNYYRTEALREKLISRGLIKE